MKTIVPFNSDIIIFALQNHNSDSHDHLGLGSWIFSPQASESSTSAEPQFKVGTVTNILDLKREKSQISIFFNTENEFEVSVCRTLCKTIKNVSCMCIILKIETEEICIISFDFSNDPQTAGRASVVEHFLSSFGHDLDCPYNDIQNAYAHTIILGHFNFGANSTRSDIKSLVEKELWNDIIVDTDILFDYRTRGTILTDFCEASMAFKPAYDDDDDHGPVYADRILWYSRPGGCNLLSSNKLSCHEKIDSPNKPISAVFDFCIENADKSFGDEESSIYILTMSNLSARLIGKEMTESDKNDDDSLWELSFDISDIFETSQPMAWQECRSKLAYSMCPSWKAETFAIRTTHHTLSAVKRKCVFIRVHAGVVDPSPVSTSCYGQAVVSLREAIREKNNAAVEFSVPITLQSILRGYMTGTLSIEKLSGTNMGTAMKDAWPLKNKDYAGIGSNRGGNSAIACCGSNKVRRSSGANDGCSVQ